jgi:hypothetical protein
MHLENKKKEKSIISLKMNNLTTNITSKNDLATTSNNNRDVSNKFTFKLPQPEQNSIKVNLSGNDIINNSSSFSKQLEKTILNENENEKENQNQNNSPVMNIKKNKQIYSNTEVEFEINKTFNKPSIFDEKNIIDKNNLDYQHSCIIKKNSMNKNKNKNKNNKNGNIINQLLGINLPDAKIITNNITTISSNNNNGDNFNSNEKINNIEASFSIYNIIQKNINKNLNIIDNKEQIEAKNTTKNYCYIF